MMTKPSEHSGYAPLDEPKGSGVKAADTYLYEIRECSGAVLCGIVLCPSCARRIRACGKQVMILDNSNRECAGRCGSHSGKANE